MSIEDKTIKISPTDLVISPVYFEVFGQFNRDRTNLLNQINNEIYLPYSTLKVRKKKKNYEVLCGVGRLEIWQKLAEESKIVVNEPPPMSCTIVTKDDDISCLQMILRENIDTKIYFTNFSQYQFFLLVRTLNKFGENPISKEFIKTELNIKESSYQNLLATHRFIINKIANIYPDFVQELTNQSEINQITKILFDLKLINYALEKVEWNELKLYFSGKMSISSFHKRYCEKVKSEIFEPVENKDLINKFSGTLKNFISELETLKEKNLINDILNDKKMSKIFDDFFKLLQKDSEKSNQNKQTKSPKYETQEDNPQTQLKLF